MDGEGDGGGGQREALRIRDVVEIQLDGCGNAAIGDALVNGVKQREIEVQIELCREVHYQEGGACLVADGAVLALLGQLEFLGAVVVVDDRRGDTVGAEVTGGRMHIFGTVCPRRRIRTVLGDDRLEVLGAHTAVAAVDAFAETHGHGVVVESQSSIDNERIPGTVEYQFASGGVVRRGIAFRVKNTVRIRTNLDGLNARRNIHGVDRMVRHWQSGIKICLGFIGQPGTDGRRGPGQRVARLVGHRIHMGVGHRAAILVQNDVEVLVGDGFTPADGLVGNLADHSVAGGGDFCPCAIALVHPHEITDGEEARTIQIQVEQFVWHSSTSGGVIRRSAKDDRILSCHVGGGGVLGVVQPGAVAGSSQQVRQIILEDIKGLRGICIGDRRSGERSVHAVVGQRGGQR